MTVTPALQDENWKEINKCVVEVGKIIQFGRLAEYAKVDMETRTFLEDRVSLQKDLSKQCLFLANEENKSSSFLFYAYSLQKWLRWSYLSGVVGRRSVWKSVLKNFTIYLFHRNLSSANCFGSLANDVILPASNWLFSCFSTSTLFLFTFVTSGCVIQEVI